MSALADWQIALGRAMQAGSHHQMLDDIHLAPDARARVARLCRSPGFRFTAKIQRSWCEARSASGARLTLLALSPEQRRDLVAEWVDRGGGRQSFLAGEAEGFLEFLAERLPEPSHALSLCRFERALLLASEAATEFRSPDLARLDDADCLLMAGRHATLVAFHADIDPLFAALERKAALPPVTAITRSIVFAPGIPRLLRATEPAEATLWQAIAAPITSAALLRQGHARSQIEAFVAEGVAEIACP